MIGQFKPGYVMLGKVNSDLLNLCQVISGYIMLGHVKSGCQVSSGYASLCQVISG